MGSFTSFIKGNSLLQRNDGFIILSLKQIRITEIIPDIIQVRVQFERLFIMLYGFQMLPTLITYHAQRIVCFNKGTIYKDGLSVLNYGLI